MQSIEVGLAPAIGSSFKNALALPLRELLLVDIGRERYGYHLAKKDGIPLTQKSKRGETI